MDDFAFYFVFGWKHILSLSSLDHILFIVTLSAIYLLSNWRQVLILVTAFTIGHSLTLALSAYNIVTASEKWVEFLIPITILVTAIYNLTQEKYSEKALRVNYFFALFFGLIHGLGFAGSIRFMLAQDQSIGLPLAAFNLGIEAGQVVLVGGILLLSYLMVNVSGLPRKWWVWGLSLLALCCASFFCYQNYPFHSS